MDVTFGAGGRDDFARIAQNDRHAGHVEVDIRAGGDKGVVSDGYFSNNDGICANPDTVFERRRTCARTSAGCAYGDALIDVDVGTENRVGANDDAAEMAKVQPWTNIGRR